MVGNSITGGYSHFLNSSRATDSKDAFDIDSENAQHNALRELLCQIFRFFGTLGLRFSFIIPVAFRTFRRLTSLGGIRLDSLGFAQTLTMLRC